MKTTRLNIKTFASLDNETYLGGTDEKGKGLTIVFNTLELLEWLDIDFMKK